MEMLTAALHMANVAANTSAFPTAPSSIKRLIDGRGVGYRQRAATRPRSAPATPARHSHGATFTAPTAASEARRVQPGTSIAQGVAQVGASASPARPSPARRALAWGAPEAAPVTASSQAATHTGVHAGNTNGCASTAGSRASTPTRDGRGSRPSRTGVRVSSPRRRACTVPAVPRSNDAPEPRASGRGWTAVSRVRRRSPESCGESSDGGVALTPLERSRSRLNPEL